MSQTQGYIYILTNPSFPDYVKIGYSQDVEARVKQLNSSECIPFGFRVYATYEVQTQKNVDKELHELIDMLNPDLRSSEILNDKLRKREFFAMTAEDAYRILQAMAIIHNCEGALKVRGQTQDEKQEEAAAKEIDTIRVERAANFSFSKCGIAPNEEVIFEWGKYVPVTAIVVNDRQVEYQGVTYSLTALAKKLLGRDRGVQGPLYFKFQNERLTDRRARLERAES